MVIKPLRALIVVSFVTLAFTATAEAKKKGGTPNSPRKPTVKTKVLNPLYLCSVSGRFCDISGILSAKNAPGCIKGRTVNVYLGGVIAGTFKTDKSGFGNFSIDTAFNGASSFLLEVPTKNAGGKICGALNLTGSVTEDGNVRIDA